MKELDLRMETWDLSKKTCVTLEGNRRNTLTQTGDFNNTTRESDMICKSKQQQLKLDLQACWSTSMQDQDQGSRDGELQWVRDPPDGNVPGDDRLPSGNLT